LVGRLSLPVAAIVHSGWQASNDGRHGHWEVAAEGRILSPDDLSIGQHELSVRFTDPTSGLDDGDGISFFVDAAGTGAA
jgi:hypothetical protein